MKKLVCLAVLVSLISGSLCGCFSNIMFIPSSDTIGKSKTFETDGFSISLTDKFTEAEVPTGFDAYFLADFCGVAVMKDEFALQKGLADQSVKEYLSSVIASSGYTGIAPQTKDGLWFFDVSNDETYARMYCYKGSDAFYIVQFACNPSVAKTLEDTFYLFAQSVEVK